MIWHIRGRVFEPRLLHQVLRFVGRVYTVQYVELRGTAHEGGVCDDSIGSTVSDAIVRSWLWLTVTRSSPLGYFGILQQVVDNWPHICGSRFSTGRLQAIEDFTFTSYPLIALPTTVKVDYRKLLR